MLVACFLGACMAGCPGKTGGAGSGAGADDSMFAGEPAGSYTTRGVIAELPSGAGGMLRIQHEPIDDFADATGEAVGMNAMLMDFPHIDGDVDLSAFEVGQAVEFVFDVYWQPRRGYIVRSMQEFADRDALLLDGFAIPRWIASLPPHDQTVDRYIVRGRMVRLPDAFNDMAIRHELIPDLKDAEGNVVGMRAMTMQLPIADLGLLEGIEPGHAVVFAMDVSFDETGVASFPVVGITRLASSVMLDPEVGD